MNAWLLAVGGFIVIVVASRVLSVFFARFHLPLITGLLFIGMICGPFGLDLLRVESWATLDFINEISLAYIAFAASAELYLKELRSRLTAIRWMTIGQLIVTFVVSAIGVYFLIDYLPFAEDFPLNARIAFSMLTACIFVARSPASAMGIIKELRAKGPFTQTSLGVTVLKDFLVIILFSVCLSISITLVEGKDFDIAFFLILIAELGTAFGIGMLVSKVLKWILQRRWSLRIKGISILVAGFLVYKLDALLGHQMEVYFHLHFTIEPLLVCIIASFWVTNYSRYRLEFTKILNELSLYIYVPFFTLAGLSLSLDILVQYALLTMVLVALRIFSIIVGAYFGGRMAGEPELFNRIGWMPYVTQAGVGLGLTTIVAGTFPQWGTNFATLIISVIVVNQIIGPPLFKWAIRRVGESRQKAQTPSFDGVWDAIIFGLEPQSIALARQLKENGWEVKLATLKPDVDVSGYDDLEIVKIEGISRATLQELDTHLAEAVVCMLTDAENLQLAELLYEHFGTRDVIVRLNHRYNQDKFHELGALIVDPSTAIVSLMDHLVRSPHAASLMLGMDQDQDTIDIELKNYDLHGLLLRDLRLPSDTIVLSVNRSGHPIISHGYTRLRMGDIITIVGKRDSLEEVATKFAR